MEDVFYAEHKHTLKPIAQTHTACGERQDGKGPLTNCARGIGIQTFSSPPISRTPSKSFYMVFW